VSWTRRIATDRVTLYLWVIRAIPTHEKGIFGTLAGLAILAKRLMQGGEIWYLDLVRKLEDLVSGQ
jgi:glutamine amidotransferase PdxT